MQRPLRTALLAALASLAAAGASAQPGPGGGTIRVMLNADLRGTDPGVNRDLNSDTITLHMLEGLVAYRENLSVGPMLAESVSLSDDGTLYTFKLRDGLTFHNGKPLTADDVVFAWKRYLDPATQWRCLPEFNGTGAAKVLDVAAVDPKTVTMKIEKPSALFLVQMARTDCGSSAIYHRDSLGADGKWATPIGTGPYQWGEWRRGQSVELVRFPGYKSRGGERDGLTGGKTAIAEKVRFVIIPESASAKAALYSGGIDVRPDFASRDLAEAKARSDVKIGTSPTMELNGILFQVNDPVLKDARIRKALSLAIDREELVAAVTEGLVKPVNSPIPLASAFSGPAQTAPWKRDIAQAKKLLAEAGYKGETIKMIVTKRYMSLFDGAVFVQQMAKEAGLNVELEVLEWATQLDKYSKGDYQSQFFSFSARLDPSLSFEMITGPKATQPRKVWDNAEAVELIRASTATSDQAKRQAIFDDLQKRFEADLPMIPLWNSVDIAAWRANVSGYQTWPASMPRLWNVTLN
ncbi:MAG TPA: ABC transporter substrate-binding protein [Beijerinckiaceae bacterium]|jgi:peptide/nickel transport system substrate-binding protein